MIAALYVAAGLVLAVAHLWSAMDRLDPSAKAGSWGFRLVTLPGMAILWPVLLRRAFQAKRGAWSPPAPEAPVPPRQLRRIHGRAFQALAIVVPVLLAAALVWRTPDLSSAPALPPALLQPEPYPEIVTLNPSQPGELPVRAQLRRGPGGALQAELSAAAALPHPAVAVYWGPPGAAGSLPHDAVFLGSVWGPAALRYALPPEAAAGGTLYFLALTGGPELLAALPLHPR